MLISFEINFFFCKKSITKNKLKMFKLILCFERFTSNIILICSQICVTQVTYHQRLKLPVYSKSSI